MRPDSAIGSPILRRRDPLKRRLIAALHNHYNWKTRRNANGW